MRGFPGLTTNQIQANFKKYLQDAIDTGQMPPSESGLDENTLYAICVVADSYPNADPTAIQDAQQNFRRQLSGKAAADQRAYRAGRLATRPK